MKGIWQYLALWQVYQWNKSNKIQPILFNTEWQETQIRPFLFRPQNKKNWTEGDSFAWTILEEIILVVKKTLKYFGYVKYVFV